MSSSTRSSCTLCCFSINLFFVRRRKSPRSPLHAAAKLRHCVTTFFCLSVKFTIRCAPGPGGRAGATGGLFENRQPRPTNLHPQYTSADIRGVVRMNSFLVAAEAPTTELLLSAIGQLGGKLLTLNVWIVPWAGSADALCRKLRPTSANRVVVCSTGTDWSYR